MQLIQGEPASSRQAPAQSDPIRSTSRRSRVWPALLFVAILALGVGLRAANLGELPTNGDESESSMNALNILDHGVPTGEYMGMPIYENLLTETWPEHPEYEFRDSSYSAKGVAIYHGWIPLYSMALSFKAFGILPDHPEATIHVRHTVEEMHRRAMAARVPAVIFGAIFIVFVFLLANEMCGTDAAWAAMLIACIGEPFVYFAREARYHSATLAISTGCCWIIWRMYKHRGWGDFVAGGILIGAMFHTHLISFCLVCAAMCLVIPAILMHRESPRIAIRGLWERIDRTSAMKLLTLGAIVALLTIPWIILTGFLNQTNHIPPARNFLSYPADLFVYPLKKIPDAIPGIAALAWVLFVEIFKSRLPARLTAPVIQHRRQIYFLLAWILIGFLAFTFLIPAASYFYKRMALGMLGPGLVFGAMLCVLITREINRARSGLIASIVFVLVVAATGKAYTPWWDDREPDDAYATIEWFRTRPLPPDAKIYCTPNDQLTLTFLSGMPVQSVAPVRKRFIDQYPGRVLMIESSPPYQTLPADEIVSLANQSGVKISEAEALRLQSPLSTRLLRIELALRCATVGPTLEDKLPFTDAAVEFQREFTEQRQRRWMANGANNPIMRDYNIPNFATWWPIFFYRFVDPLSRSGEHLNYVERIKNSHAEVLPAGWVIFDCPPIARSGMGDVAPDGKTVMLRYSEASGPYRD